MAATEEGDGQTEGHSHNGPEDSVQPIPPAEGRAEQAVMWYDITVGKIVAVAGVLLTLFAVTASLDGQELLPPGTQIPFAVYLFGFFGAMARSLLSLVTDVDPETGDIPFIERSWLYIVRLGLRLVGALCLAAGIYLTQTALNEALVLDFAPGDSLIAGVAFLAGFYVEQTYDLLGVVARRVLRLSDHDSGGAGSATEKVSGVSFDVVRGTQRPEEARWYKDIRGLGLFTLGLALLSVGFVASLGGDILPLVPSVNEPVPAYVYLYALLGALGYLFTTLFKQFDRSPLSFGQKAIRIPAALLLAAGLYMFTQFFVTEATAPDGLVGGLAFLIGLYVNVAIVTLDAIASRIFAKLTQSSS